MKTYNEILIAAESATTLAELAILKVDLMLNYDRWSRAELLFAQEFLKALAEKVRLQQQLKRLV